MCLPTPCVTLQNSAIPLSQCWVSTSSCVTGSTAVSYLLRCQHPWSRDGFRLMGLSWMNRIWDVFSQGLMAVNKIKSLGFFCRQGSFWDTKTLSSVGSRKIEAFPSVEMHWEFVGGSSDLREKWSVAEPHSSLFFLWQCPPPTQEQSYSVCWTTLGGAQDQGVKTCRFHALREKEEIDRSQPWCLWGLYWIWWVRGSGTPILLPSALGSHFCGQHWLSSYASYCTEGFGYCLPPGPWQLVGKPLGQLWVMKLITAAGEWDCGCLSPHPHPQTPTFTFASSPRGSKSGRRKQGQQLLGSLAGKMWPLLLLVAFLLSPRARAGEWPFPPSGAQLHPIDSEGRPPRHLLALYHWAACMSPPFPASDAEGRNSIRPTWRVAMRV